MDGCLIRSGESSLNWDRESLTTKQRLTTSADDGLVAAWQAPPSAGHHPPATWIGRVKDEVLTTTGFSITSGLDVEGQLSEVRSRFLRLMSEFGRVVPQDPAGHLVGELGDRGADWRSRQPFHTDGGDLLALLCIRPAAVGGETRLASAAFVHDSIGELCPEGFHHLHEPWRFHRRNRPGPLTYERSVFSCAERGTECFYLPGTARETPLVDGIPLSRPQLWALDVMDGVLDNPRSHVRVRLQAGDLLIVNNRTVLHGRDHYVDNNGLRRLLLRSWLALPTERGAQNSPTTRPPISLRYSRT